MKTRRCLPMFVLCVALTVAADLSHAQSLPPEPGDEFLVQEDVNVVTGFYIREYSLSIDGAIDYITARKIVSFEHNEYGNTVIDAEANPLFYWFDEHKAGRFRMWIDRKGEGCRCDVVPYTALVAQ